MLIDVVRARHVPVPGVVAVVAGILGNPPVQILDLLGVDVDTPEVARLGAAVDVLVGADVQPVAEELGHLAEIPHPPRVERKAVQMPAHEADHVDGVVLRVVRRAVDRFPRHRDAPVLRVAGLRIVAEHARSRPALPDVRVVGERHPLGVVGRAVGRVRGREDAPVGEDDQRLVELGDGELAPRRQHQLLRLEADFRRVRVVVVRHQTGMLGVARRGRRRVVEDAVFRIEPRVPAAAVGQSGQADALAHARLVDRLEVVFREHGEPVLPSDFCHEELLRGDRESCRRLSYAWIRRLASGAPVRHAPVPPARRNSRHPRPYRSYRQSRQYRPSPLVVPFLACLLPPHLSQSNVIRSRILRSTPCALVCQ